MVITVGIQYVNEVEKLLQNKKEKKNIFNFFRNTCRASLQSKSVSKEFSHTTMKSLPHVPAHITLA